MIRNLLNINLAPSNLRRVESIIEIAKSAMVYIDVGIGNAIENLATGDNDSDKLRQLTLQRIAIAELLNQAIHEKEILEWIFKLNPQLKR